MYDPTASIQPGTTVEEYTEFPDQELVPVQVEEELVANVHIELGVFFDTASDGTNRAFFNNVTYRTVRQIIFQVLLGNADVEESLNSP